MNIRLLIWLSVGVMLTGCMSNVYTGATLVYDRHKVYIKVNDFQLGAQANRALYQDKVFKRPDCSIEVAVINRDVLLVGQVPTLALRQEAYARVQALPGIRRLFKQLDVSLERKDAIKDSWITTKIRSQIIANSEIDPNHFKVVTYNQIVYLMGDVIPAQAAHVIYYARHCVGVKRVVKLFKYYNLSDQPAT